MNKEIYQKIKNIKNKFEGIEIVGIVGSFTRSENYNDIDLLYKIDKNFLKEIDPFYFFTYLENIKREIEKELNINVDLIDVSTLNNIAKKYMMKDLLDV